MSGISQLADDAVRLYRPKLRLFRNAFGKLGVGVCLIAISMVIVVTFSHFAYRSIQSDLATSSTMIESRNGYKILYLIELLSENDVPDRRLYRAELDELANSMDIAMKLILNGDKSLGVTPHKLPDVMSNLRYSANFWIAEARPILDKTLQELDRNGPKVEEYIAQLDKVIVKHSTMVSGGLRTIRDTIITGIRNTQHVQIALSIVAIFMLLIVLLVVKEGSTRAQELTEIANRIAGGDLNLEVPVRGHDEFAALGTSFNAVTKKLAGLIEKERKDKQKLEQIVRTMSETAETLADSASELLKSASLQADGMKEQAEILEQTVSSVNEVLATTKRAVTGATAVASSSSEAAEVSKNGREAIDETVSAMTTVQEKSDAIAESIRSLSEDGKSIEHIVTVVNDIADQTNMLALNAAIEASRAGEHGRGFSVVASEIRSLSEKSKTATSQVQHILSKILQSTNVAVELTDVGRNSVEQALSTVEKAGTTIRTLEQMISEGAKMATEIMATSECQSSGMVQIQAAITHISDVSGKNLVAMKKTEDTAGQLNDVGEKLKKLAMANV